jgi:hypothetical protein
LKKLEGGISTMTHWIIAIGLGMFWQGGLIVWVAGLPTVLQSGETTDVEKGTPAAFMRFWLDQYSFIGLVLAVSGIVMTAWGLLR